MNNAKMYQGRKTPYRDYCGYYTCIAGWRSHNYSPQSYQQDFGGAHIFGYAYLVQTDLQEPKLC